MTWYVYIIRSNSGVLYTGITTDTSRRLKQHNNGRGAKFTRGRGPWHLVYQESLPDKGVALSREKQIKRLPKPAKLSLAGLS